ncbi:hypothetical protein ACH5RR_021373 [Cinchona calisaya]|uniref:GDSL esterase/lipase n=1 Tax=Cinchona calisaya TaxID=153742 RepID=A0ABD2ZI22_9GENT
MSIQVFLLSILLIYGTSLGGFGVEGSHRGHKHYHRKNKHHLHSKFGIKKLFVFGDSYADTGNVPEMWTDKPYGTTFPGKPDGRYSDGHIFTDFVAEYLGLESPMPYMLREYNKKKLHYGMNFAFGGAGAFQTLFPRPNISTQVGYFEELINNELYTTYDLEKSLALVTLSGNDYSAFIARGGNYADLLVTFIPEVVNELARNLKRISKLGVKRIAVGSLPPLGCVPFITKPGGYMKCDELDNLGSDQHNLLLTDAVAKLNNESLSTDFGMLNLDSTFLTIFNHSGYPKENLKLATPYKPCCEGVGNYSCGDVDKNGKAMYTVCQNPKSAFFWDRVHPTQAGWRSIVAILKPLLKEISKFS